MGKEVVSSVKMIQPLFVLWGSFIASCSVDNNIVSQYWIDGVAYDLFAKMDYASKIIVVSK